MDKNQLIEDLRAQAERIEDPRERAEYLDTIERERGRIEEFERLEHRLELRLTRVKRFAVAMILLLVALLGVLVYLAF